MCYLIFTNKNTNWKFHKLHTSSVRQSSPLRPLKIESIFTYFEPHRPTDFDWLAVSRYVRTITDILLMTWKQKNIERLNKIIAYQPLVRSFRVSLPLSILCPLRYLTFSRARCLHLSLSLYLFIFSNFYQLVKSVWKRLLPLLCYVLFTRAFYSC